MAGVRRGAALLAGVGGGGCRAGPCRAAPPPAARRGFAATALRRSYDVRRVEITPLEQRKVTFDTHALVQDLEAHGFGKEQAETIVSALITLSNVSLDTVYKDMVTQAQQEITLQQIMAHLDSIRKDMVILEKSEFANLRAENEKMKIELDQVKQQLLFTDQEKKLMEATTEFHKKTSQKKPQNTAGPFFCNASTPLQINVLDTRCLPSSTEYYQMTLLWFLEHISIVPRRSINKGPGHNTDHCT
ncbi:coiled-coil domain-containing protein 90B, mitochondrial isoform X6 [Apteryx mantelli]|uniref:Coiled-coil domain-containing protein 90B, mitochondrial isoform X6 n=1 Tax=Apteryx mantelli TaxID=2696672 RepID=A0ABM4G702_9AVES